MLETLEAIKTHLNNDPTLQTNQIYVIGPDRSIGWGKTWGKTGRSANSHQAKRLLAYHHYKAKSRTSYVAQISIKQDTIHIIKSTLDLLDPHPSIEIDLNDPNFIRQIVQNLYQIAQKSHSFELIPHSPGELS